MPALIAQADRRLRSGAAGQSRRHATAERLLAALLRSATELGASDLRLAPRPGGAWACVRCHGAVRKLGDFSPHLLDALCAVAARGLGTGAQCARYRFESTLGSCLAGRTAFIRILDQQAPPIALDAIGYQAADLETIRHILGAPSGLVLLLGPAGCGKTTSLYSMLEVLDPQRRSVQTLESHIRRPVDQWLQFQLPADSCAEPDRWEQGLFWLLQNGPDAILLGQIASPGVARLALQAARGGHLVLSTMVLERANDVLAEFQRLQAHQAQVLEALSLVVAQRLVGRLCPHCSQPDDRDEVRRALAAALNTWLAQAKVQARRSSPEGCRHCHGTGYDGKTLIYELLEIDSRARGLIASGADAIELERALLADGRTLWDRGLARVADGTTSLDALLAGLRSPR